MSGTGRKSARRVGEPQRHRRTARRDDHLHRSCRVRESHRYCSTTRARAERGGWQIPLAFATGIVGRRSCSIASLSSASNRFVSGPGSEISSMDLAAERLISNSASSWHRGASNAKKSSTPASVVTLHRLSTRTPESAAESRVRIRPSSGGDAAVHGAGQAMDNIPRIGCEGVVLVGLEETKAKTANVSLLPAVE